MSVIAGSTITQTITLGPGSYPHYASPLTITSTGAVEVNSTAAGVAGILGPVGTAWTVANLGTVESIGSQGLGIDLLSGGLVSNGSTSVATATILGAQGGVYVSGAAGTVVNYGTILSTATGANGNGIYLSAGGSVTNLGVIHGNNHGVLIAGGAGTVVNSGSISTTVALHAGGAVTNTGTGVIQAVQFGVVIKGAAGSVSNSGTIVVTSAATGEAIYLGAGGTVTNQLGGTISAVRSDILLLNAAGTVKNRGLIESTGTAASSRTVDLEAGGMVVNYGTIIGAGSASLGLGVFLGAGGNVTNATSASIAGYGGVEIFGATGTLTNRGTIQSTGTGFGAQAVDLLTGGKVNNYGTLLGTNTGASGINAGSGPSYIFNAAGALIEGWLNGIDQFSGVGTVANRGTIKATGPSSTGVYLTGGGSITNAGAGLISATADAVVIAGSRGTVVNSGTIEGPNLGVWLKAGGLVTNSGTVTSTSGDGVTFGFTGAGVGTLINTGRITAANLGVWLTGGGTVTNGSSGATAASIAGVFDGVEISAATGTVVNFGTVTETATFGASVYLADGGRVTNGASGAASALISGASNGVAIFFAPGSVINFATIESIGTAGYGVVLSNGGSVANSGTILEIGTSGAAARLGAGGSVGNSAAAALIKGYRGVEILGAGSVANSGSIIATGTAFSLAGVYLAAGGSINNLGAASLIRGGSEGIYLTGTIGTLSNAGTILGVRDLGVDFEHGGIITNSGIITGGSDKAIAMYGFGTVINSGKITGNFDAGVALYGGGVLTNSGKITGNNGKGIYIALGVSTVTTTGTITATGTAGNGVSLFAGRVTNGAATATGALISGSHFGVEIQNSAGNVVNFGSITSSADTGIWLYAGTVVNGPSGARHALISGAFDGVFVAAGNGTVNNYGTVVGGASNDGVCLYAGGFVANGRNGATTALIDGYSSGIEIQHSRGTVVNLGSVAATGSSGIGIDLLAGGTVTDAGRITAASGTAISFGGTTANRLILDPGYHLGGKVLGSASAGATNTLELGSTAATGTVTSVIASEFVHFGAVIVDPGAKWALASNNTIAVGQTLTIAGTLTDFGTLTNLGVITGGGELIVDPATLVNSGSIGVTVALSGGGYLDNRTTGKITAVGTAVYATGGAATIVNQGQITAAGGVGVRLLAGGRVTNQSPGSITGGGGGVYIRGGAGTVVNLGTVGNAIVLGSGGSVTNGASGSTSGLVTGPGSAIETFGSASTVTNFGTIVGTGTNGIAVGLAAGGSVINGHGGSTGGLITGAAGGIDISGGAGTVVNFGTVAATYTGPLFGIGIGLTGGGSVVNGRSGSPGGRITGSDFGIGISGSGGTVTNFGTIVGTTGNGVGLLAGGRVTNGSGASTGATIRGNTGVEILGTAVGTVVNFGTIAGTGGTAISLGTGNDRVVIEKGSVLQGAVKGFHIGDTFDLPFMSFSSIGTVALKSGNVLRVVENGGTFNINLDPSQSFAGDFFHLSSDGGTGTLITENHTPPAPYSISPNPATVLDNAGQLIFTISRTSFSGPAVVYASVVDDQGFANNGEYTFANDSEVFFAAGVASVKVSVGITDTGAASGSEAFRFIIQQHRTDPISTSLASDKFTITNTTAPAAAVAAARITFADFVPASQNLGAPNSTSPSNHPAGSIAANEQASAGGQLLFAAGHLGGSLLSMAGGVNHNSLLPA